MRVPPGKAMVHTVDFFRAFIDDPYIFGKVAANHALGDIFAMGAEAQSATAIVTVPSGLEAKVEDLLFQMMSGAIEVLNEANCALVGGHTGEGKELALGFAVNGLIDEIWRGDAQRRHAAGRRADPDQTDRHRHAVCCARAARGQRPLDRRRAHSMCQSNRLGAQCLREHGATACTDLTGFGLLGHLVEMTRPSGVDAELESRSAAAAGWRAKTVAAGILSSLQPRERAPAPCAPQSGSAGQHPRYPLIFDPQTAGGLLASVPQERADDCIEALRALGYARQWRSGGYSRRGRRWSRLRWWVDGARVHRRNLATSSIGAGFRTKKAGKARRRWSFSCS